MRADTLQHYRLTVLPLILKNVDDLNRLEFGGGIKNTQIIGLKTVWSGKLNDLRAVLWRQGQPMQVLDKTPVTDGSHTNSYSITFPTALSRRGDIVGADYYQFTGAYSGVRCTAVLWHNRKRSNLEGFPGDTDSIAREVNDAGEIVGNYIHNNHSPVSDSNDLPPGESGNHAFLISHGQVKTLWLGIAMGINNRGQIIGIQDEGDETNQRSKGVLWRHGRITFLKMQPTAINERGEIAGNKPLTEDTGRACLWRRGRTRLLCQQISHAYALNNQGQIVGEQESPHSTHTSRATLWHAGRNYDLNDCTPRPRGWVMEKAVGINDKGWIIGEGSIYRSLKDRIPSGQFTFLLTPLRGKRQALWHSGNGCS